MAGTLRRLGPTKFVFLEQVGRFADTVSCCIPFTFITASSGGSNSAIDGGLSTGNLAQLPNLPWSQEEGEETANSLKAKQKWKSRYIVYGRE